MPAKKKKLPTFTQWLRRMDSPTTLNATVSGAVKRAADYTYMSDWPRRATKEESFVIWYRSQSFSVTELHPVWSYYVDFCLAGAKMPVTDRKKPAGGPRLTAAARSSLTKLKTTLYKGVTASELIEHALAEYVGNKAL